MHGDFLRQCRNLGLTAADYPFNTDRMGIRSLAAAARQACLDTFGRGARLAGATHLNGLPSEDNAPAAQQALDVVEFDGHRLDVRLKVVVRDPLGFEQEFEIERIWLLVIIDVYSRAVLGYHVSLNREYSRYDVIRTIEAALEPHPPRQFTLPGVGMARSAVSRLEIAVIALAKGGVATFVIAAAGPMTVLSALVASLVRGEGFISGMHIVLIVLNMVAGLVVYFSFVFGRPGKVKMEISKTRQLIEPASGDKAK